MNVTKYLSLRTLLAALSLSAVFGACNDSGGAPRYQPFSTQSYASPLAEVTLLFENGEAAGLVTQATAATDYAALSDAYQTNDVPGLSYTLQSAFQGATDVHSSPVTGLGTYLDTQYQAALALGAAATSADPDAARHLGYAKEGLEKLPLTYLYYAMYEALTLRTRDGLDQAWAYYSFVPGPGGASMGIHHAADEYVPDPVAFHADLEAHLLEARAIVEANTTSGTDPVGSNAQLDAVIAHIDEVLLTAFAQGARHYLVALRDTPGDGPDGSLIEGRLFWLAVRPYAERIDSAAAAAVTTAFYPTGEPAQNATDLQVAYGLDAFADAAYDGNAVAGIAGIDALLAALGAP